MSKVGLSPDQLGAVFPFHVAFRADGRVTQRGRTLARVVPGLRPGVPIESCFELMRPRMGFDLAAIADMPTSVFVLRALHHPLKLRGQIVVSDGVALFLGSPWVTELEEVTSAGLKIGDFAIHDPLVDYLALLQSKHAALEDVRRLADRLEEEKGRVEVLYGQVAGLSSRLSALIANLPFGVLVEDEHRRIVLANEQLCGIFGIPGPPADLIGQDCSESANGAAQLFVEPRAFDARIHEILGARAPVLGEPLSCVDGRTLERDYVPIFDGRGYRGHLWQYRDVTLRRRAEAELESAKLEAEEANQAKVQFLAMMSHEMRTPLGVIIGLTELLGEMEWEEEGSLYLSRVASNADVLLTLIEDILDFSKLEAGQIRLNPGPYSAAKIAREAADALGFRAEAKALRIQVDADPELEAPLLLDSARLRQVLLNLVGNAIKFTPQGEVRVEIRALAGGAPDQVRVRYAVHDTGPGIPDEMKPRVFERFVRAESAENVRAGGAGLGLSIVRSLVELMGGAVEVEDRPGGGTCFHFTLDHPLAFLAEPREPSAPGRPALTLEPGHRTRVLVAEDNEDNRTLLRRQLSRLGCVADFAENGELAFELLGRESYDLLLTDLEMPHWDGFRLARAIRASGELSGLPIIALSAHALPGYRERCAEAGMDDYVTKPVRQHTLARVISRWAGERTATWTITTPEAVEPSEEFLVTPDPDIADLVEPYLVERRRDVATMRALLGAGRVDELRRFAHKLAGTGSAYGFDRLTTLGRALELDLGAMTSEGIEGRLSELEQYLARVRVAVPEPQPSPG